MFYLPFNFIILHFFLDKLLISKSLQGNLSIHNLNQETCRCVEMLSRPIYGNIDVFLFVFVLFNLTYVV